MVDASPVRRFNPKLIKKIKRARNWRDIRRLITAARDADAVELATALHATQNTLGLAVLQLPDNDARKLCNFVDATLWRLHKQMPHQELGKRSHTLANTLTSLARLHIRPSPERLARLCDEALRTVPKATKQSVANTLMALALLQARDEEAGPLMQALTACAGAMVRLFPSIVSQHGVWACLPVR